MKFKKAIEWLESMKKAINCDMPPEEGYLNEYGDKIDEIVNMLQNCEKYKAIVKDIEKDFDELHCNIISEHAFNIIKQKYFPKKINRIIEVEVEASNMEVIDELAKEIEDMANGQYHRKGKIEVIRTRWIRN